MRSMHVHDVLNYRPFLVALVSSCRSSPLHRHLARQDFTSRSPMVHVSGLWHDMWVGLTVFAVLFSGAGMSGIGIAAQAGRGRPLVTGHPKPC